MIKLINWLFGGPSRGELDEQAAFARHERNEARERRTHVERTGAAIRMTLEENHIGERFELALHPRGWEPR